MAEFPHQPESLGDFVEPSQLPILNYDMREKEASKIFKLLSLVSLFVQWLGLFPNNDNNSWWGS